MYGRSGLDGKVAWCPVCGYPLVPGSISLECPAHGIMMTIEAMYANGGDAVCNGCGRTVRKNYVFCPFCRHPVSAP
ncbi:MAG: hypothetical protein A4E32_01136 [Methanomassiliicoccales archaeon PtaU1.Bin124]|nr:MAG: hypothetical protein A4E32_01136 [Methanomassiliicoccales archaeon PtaU1.Bin124]